MKPITIFDVDGVLTNPYTKKPNIELLSYIASLLKQSQPVGIITGRAVEWVERHILPKIQYNDHLFISGEKGSVQLTFKDLQRNIKINPSIEIPQEITTKIKAKLQEYSDIFIDTDKHVMLSLEMTGGSDTQQIDQQQKQLDALENWIHQTILPLYPQLTVERSQIALDIQDKQVNKKLGTKTFLDFLSSKNVHAESFIMFGDNASDAVVIEEIIKQGKKGEFVYVGEKSLENSYNFPVYQAQKKYDQGVLEFIEKN